MRIVKTTKCKTVKSESRLYFHFKERTPRHLFKFITKDRSFIYLVNVLLPNFFANKRMNEVVSEKIEQKVFVCGLNLENAYSSKFDCLKNFSDLALLQKFVTLKGKHSSIQIFFHSVCLLLRTSILFSRNLYCCQF